MKKQKLNPHQKKFLKQIGRNIRKYRKDKKLSQQELGYKIDTDKPHISRAESGTHNFSVLTALRFAEGLEIPVSKLFE
jgi:transcriptional regulator with XRE-family HTH domain